MMNLSQLRKKYRPASPVEALEDLAIVCRNAKRENFTPPMLVIVLSSGYTFRGYLVNASEPDAADKSFLFSVENSAQGDGANDLLYVQGHRIETVTFLSVDDYSGILPRFNDKVPGSPESP